MSVCPEDDGIGPAGRPIGVPSPAGRKDLLHSRGALLGFDGVKTGLTAGPDGAAGETGVTPDVIWLATAIGGGISVAAVGGSAEVMRHVWNGDYEMAGTFNGNPLARPGNGSSRSSTTRMILTASWGILPLLLLPSGRNSGTPPTSTSSSRLLPALFEVGGQPRRRGLAAPGRAEQGEELAAGCLQVDLNDRDFRETLGQRGQLNPATGRLGYLPFSRSVRASSPLPRPGAHSNPS